MALAMCKKTKGFTIVELLISLSMVCIISVATLQHAGIWSKALHNRQSDELREFTKALSSIVFNCRSMATMLRKDIYLHVDNGFICIENDARTSMARTTGIAEIDADVFGVSNCELFFLGLRNEKFSPIEGVDSFGKENATDKRVSDGRILFSGKSFSPFRLKFRHRDGGTHSIVAFQLYGIKLESGN
jgi:prepilin-type N-terminal cleavage/methylation domain-containing protein